MLVPILQEVFLRERLRACPSTLHATMRQTEHICSKKYPGTSAVRRWTAVAFELHEAVAKWELKGKGYSARVNSRRERVIFHSCSSCSIWQRWEVLQNTKAANPPATLPGHCCYMNDKLPNASVEERTMPTPASQLYLGVILLVTRTRQILGSRSTKKNKVER